ncbi:MAG: hypothetical protein NVS4B13_03140 [Candidatus Elarobacter sp.]
MLCDELGREEFGLRHEFLGMMLGLAPDAAADVTVSLRQMELIDYLDEHLVVLNRDELLDVSCECYEAQRRFSPRAA